MKKQRAGILGIIITVLFSAAACQRATTNGAGGMRKAIALAELNNGDMVEVNCLVKASKMNVDPRTVCSVITQDDIKSVTSVQQALQMKATNKSKCVYKCTGNCGWNDYYANFNTYYYSYGNNIPAQNWQTQFGMPQNYYYQYMYSYNSQPQYPQQNWYGGGYPSYPPYGGTAYPGSCGQNAWYGPDFTRYGGCYNQVFFM